MSRLLHLISIYYKFAQRQREAVKSHSVLDRLTKAVGKKSKLGKLLTGYQQLREANYISQHFSSYLEPVVATSESLCEESFKIRHNVYCDELSFEPVRESGMETDEFDPEKQVFRHHDMLKFLGIPLD